MTQQEFETRTGIKVTPSEYEDIQNIYMNTNMDKDEFCKDWKEHNSSRILIEYYNQSESLRGKLDKILYERIELVDWLILKAHDENCDALRNKACNMSSVSYVVMRTLQMGLPLWDEDIEWVKGHLEDMLSGHNPAAEI